MGMYSFSIIIPHKNIPELLERCLASIPERDDVQVIVVDDSSDERVVDFGRFPGLGRPNTEVIFHKSPIGGSGGVGVARNVGLGVARGKWLVFADADDFFHPSIGEAFDRHVDSDADMVFFRHDSIDDATMEPTCINTSRLRAMDAFESRGDETALRYRVSVPWGRFVKRELVDTHHIKFDEVRFSASVMFSLQAGHWARTIAVDDTVVYCNVRREGALTHEGRMDWDAMATRFEVDRRAAVFAAEVGRGGLLEGVLVDRWMELRQIDRRRARALLPELQAVCSRWKRLRYIFLGR